MSLVGGIAHDLRLTFADADECPAVAVFWLTTREEQAARFTGAHIILNEYRYTEDIELAKTWIDKGGTARLLKAWRLPNGMYAMRDPKVASVAAVNPYRGLEA